MLWNTVQTLGMRFAKPRDLWRRAERAVSKGRRGAADAIYAHLAHRTHRTADDFYYAAMASLHLHKVPESLAILERGQVAHPEAPLLHALYLQACIVHGHVERYRTFSPTVPRRELKALSEPYDIYRTVIAGGATEVFVFKYADIESSCDANQVRALEEEFFSSLRTHAHPFQRARMLVLFARYFDLSDDFADRLLRAVAPPSDTSDFASLQQSHVLHMLDALTAPMVLSGRTSSAEVSERFTKTCLRFADPPTGSEDRGPGLPEHAATRADRGDPPGLPGRLAQPIETMTLNWTPWQPLLCSGATDRYAPAMAAFEKVLLRTWPRLGFVAPHVNRPRDPVADPSRKVRVGFAVHDSMPMMSGLAERLDSRRFETVFLRPGKQGASRSATSWVTRVDETVQYPDHDVHAAIDVIAKQECDIIVSGPSVASVFFPMVARLAPLQMVLLEPHWLNGMHNVDYYVSWAPAEPADPKPFYSSAVAYLDHPPYWIERPAATPTTPMPPHERADVRRRLLGAHANARVYLCASTPPKIHPDMDATLASLLEADPEAVLVLFRADYPPTQTLKRRLRQRLGDAFRRVVFLSTLAPEDAHALLLAVDCCLDSFPMTGMSSSFDGMMLGAPIVTLPSSVPFGRWTAALYEHIGVTGLTAGSRQEYLHTAMRLANDPRWREEKSAEIKVRAARFVESEASSREFQDFLWSAWERKLSGLPPAHWLDRRWQEHSAAVGA